MAPQLVYAGILAAAFVQVISVFTAKDDINALSVDDAESQGLAAQQCLLQTSLNLQTREKIEVAAEGQASLAAHAGVQSSGGTNIVNVDQSGKTENVIEDTNSTKSWPASLLQVFDRGTDEEMAAVKASLTTMKDQNASVPVKNKAVLMALEIIPLCGPLGIDRFYLGNMPLGIAKLLVCLCTCFVGGIIWGAIDAIIIIINGLTRSDHINIAGMRAIFPDAHQVETAHTLAIVAIVLQAFCCCCGGGILGLCARTVSKRFVQQRSLDR